jgi:DNA-binding CsgD family transcriptional regulator
VLLERERELGELSSAIAEAQGGRGCAVGIEAAAGLGKTRLLGEARTLGSEAGLSVLAGRATELERDFPFALVRQLLAAEIAGLSDGERERVFEGATAARGALGMEEDAGAPDTFAVLHALYWVTAALAERNPLLLAVDDTHTADVASLDYLGFLLPRLEELSVLLVVTARPDESDPAGSFRRVMADPVVRLMPLAPLSAEASAILLGEELEAEPAPPFTAACFEASGGNPFLLRELSRSAVQRGMEPLAENAEQVGELVPERVAHTVMARIDRLPTEAAAVARSLAVLGDRSDLRLVAELAGIDPESAAAAADSLRGGAILDPQPLMRFVHPLVRSAVYADIPAGERGQRHAEAAKALRRVGASPEQIATQLLVSEPQGGAAAVETLVEAGERALASGAPRSAVAYLSRALREPPSPELRTSVLGPLITASLRAADHAALASIEADVRAEMDRQPSLRVEWAIDLATLMALGARFEEAGSLLRKAIEIAVDRGEVEKAFQFEAQLRTIGMMGLSQPEVNLDRYRDQIDPEAPGGRLAAALEAGSAAAGGKAGAAADAAKRALGEDGALFAEELDFTAPTLVIFTLLVSDEFEEAQRGARQALSFALERGATNEISLARALNGLVSWLGGDLSAAEADLRQGIELARLAGLPPVILMFAPLLVDVLVQRDELQAAAAELEALGALDGAQLPPIPTFLGIFLARGHWLFEKGDYEAAIADFDRVATLADSVGFGGGPALMVTAFAVPALLALGRREEAEEWAAGALDTAEQWGPPPGVGGVLAAMAATRSGEERIEMLEEAVRLLDGSLLRASHMAALYDLGVALRRQGRRAEARVPLREAIDLARRRGAVLIARRASEELQATGEKVRSYAPIGAESLTPSERRVAELAASGMTNRQIAQSLFVTVKTVEAHLSAAYDKLDIESRRQLPAALGNGAAPPA